MPVLVITRSLLSPREQRGELAKREALGGDPPAGLLVHIRADASDDEKVSVDVWETTEQYERFLSDRRLPGVGQIEHEVDLAEQRALASVTAMPVEHAAIAVALVTDYGDEVRSVTAL